MEILYDDIASTFFLSFCLITWIVFRGGLLP